ncbi:MAG TPA: hypothetical protein VH309_00995 [Elusimicrobiota bacterium]|jgi:multidrug efflux pump subunit AcrA (membrane-fusion protein)|nr:hypothetical protein [Elusimicrobiota bacterium]
MRRELFALCAAAALAACGRRAAFVAPPLEDAPVLATAALTDIPVRIPAYGLSLPDGRFEVNIEAGDARSVRPGEDATVLAPGQEPIPGRVVRVLRVASVETGQALAWLAAQGNGRVPPNEFVSANIVVAVKRRALAVPKSAVLVRDGRTWVVRAEAGEGGKAAYVPVQVATGDESDTGIEILSGLKPGDRVVTTGAVGLLYPDFKAASED